MSSYTTTSTTTAMPTYNKITADIAIDLVKHIKILEQYGRLSIETSTLQQLAPNLVFNNLIRYNELVTILICALQALINK